MKLLVCTRSDKSLKEMSSMTHPILKHFAYQWNADFLVLDERSNEETCLDARGKVFYRLCRLRELFEGYDRILHIDTDIVINRFCPNIFNEVPYDQIGTVLEDKGSRAENRRMRIVKVQAEWGWIGWKTGYINTGIFLASKPHKDLFNSFQGKFWCDLGYDDVQWGYMINYLKLPIFELHYFFNGMSMFCEPWNQSPSRFEFHLIHYAGQALFPDKGNRSRLELIRDDIDEIWGDRF